MADFRTLPDVLIDLAEEAERFFKKNGFAATRERQDISYPSTPALVCRRKPTVLFIDVAAKFEERRLLAWTSFGQSMSSDTQIAVVTRSGSPLVRKATWLRRNKVGLYVRDGGALVEVIAPQDLSVQMKLPDLGDASAACRKALGPAFDQIQRGSWREGFESACQALEQLARKHVLLSLEAPRLQFREKNGNPIAVTKAQVKKMTLGQLAVLMGKASPMNARDAVIAKALPRINRARVDVAHKKYTREAALRKSVGALIWVIFNAVQAVA
jgi:hypothetical protein